MAGITKHMLLLKQNKFIGHALRKYSSALYMTGDKAKETFSVVTPHLDIEKRFEDIESLKNNVKIRGMEVDVDSIKAMWEVSKKIEADRKTLEARRVEIAKKIKELGASKDDNDKEIEKLKLHGKLIRDDLKTTVKAVWGVENKVVPKVLRLPNDLDSRTPVAEPMVISQCGEVLGKASVASHLETGEKLNVLEYFNPEFYYLKGKAAIFELGVLNYFADRISEANFIKFCNSDFSRSVVVEGCGVDHENPSETYILEDTDELIQTKDPNRLHLVGGASLMSFCAFHAKQIVPASALPLKFVAIGRQYKPKKENGRGLFGVCQSSAVELFVSNKDDQVMAEFDNCVTLITKLYQDLGYPFRVVYMPAKELRLYESLRVSFQMYSLHLQSYIETGHLSLCGDFVSKRLLLQYGTEKQLKFTHVISGTVVAVPKMFACLLELYSDFESVPISKELRKYLV